MQKIRDGCGTMKRAAAYGIYIWHIEERNIILQQSGGIFMSEKTAEIVKNIIDSYRKHTLTTQIDKVSQPNREIVVDVLESIRKLVFPGFFEVKNLKSEYIEYYVGELIEDIRYHLKKQMMKAYLCCDPATCGFAGAIGEQVEAKCDEFLMQIGKIRKYLETDVQAAFDGDPAAYSMEEIIYSYPGVYAITVYRIAQELFTLGVPLITRIMTEHAHGKTGIDIHPGATIGKHFFIDHGTGIVIGETTTIGDHVKIYQGVTLGGLSTKGGQAIKGTKRHPDIRDYVTIYSGASILGGTTVIGEGSTIGGNAFVTSSVPANTTVLMKNPELEYKS